MHSKAKDVAAYLQEVPEDRRESLARMRRLCQRHLAGYEEGMDYGMPSYKRNGVVEVGFASQKNYISLYILKEAVVKANRAGLRGLNVGKGCIQYTRSDRIDFAVVKKLLIDTRKSKDPVC